jgi:DNA-binding NarL/FixJ family response regulator
VSRRDAARLTTDPLVAQWLVLAQKSDGPRRRRRAPTEPPIRLLLVESQAIVRLGMVTLFATARTCEVIAEASSAEQAVSAALTLGPDIVVMDADLVGGAGIVACRQIRAENPQVKVIMFASRTDPELVIAAIHAGASAFVLKLAEPTRLVDAVEAVDAGRVVLDPALTDDVVGWLQGHQQRAQPLARLSDQERKILHLIAAGKTNREIAAAMTLSEHTVRTYVSGLLKKLGSTSRSEAAALFARHELDATG